jgi:hypothetical protein
MFTVMEASNSSVLLEPLLPGATLLLTIQVSFIGLRLGYKPLLLVLLLATMQVFQFTMSVVLWRMRLSLSKLII